MTASNLRLVQFLDANTTIGAAVRLMMVYPAFSRRPLGPWVDILDGQAKRGHQTFVLENEKKLVGFLGFGLISEQVGDRWVKGGRAPTYNECLTGDCLLVNAWIAGSPQVGRFIWRAAFRPLTRGRKAAFGMRFYPDGRVRPARLTLPGSSSPGGVLLALDSGRIETSPVRSDNHLEDVYRSSNANELTS